MLLRSPPATAASWRPVRAGRAVASQKRQAGTPLPLERGIGLVVRRDEHEAVVCDRVIDSDAGPWLRRQPRWTRDRASGCGCARVAAQQDIAAVRSAAGSSVSSSGSRPCPGAVELRAAAAAALSRTEASQALAAVQNWPRLCVHRRSAPSGVSAHGLCAPRTSSGTPSVCSSVDVALTVDCVRYSAAVAAVKPECSTVAIVKRFQLLCS